MADTKDPRHLIRSDDPPEAPEDAVKQTVTTMWGMYVQMFEAARRKVADRHPNLLTAPGRELREFHALGCKLLAFFEEMVERRRQVSDVDPWRFGLLLHWMTEEAEAGMSVWEVFKRAGAWDDDSFAEWAGRVTGVGYKAWHAWMHAARVFILSDKGQKLMERHDVDQETFADRVPIGKAIRATSKMATRGLEPHQEEALLDPKVTFSQMRHRLALSEEDYRQYEEAQEAEDERWVNEGNRTVVMEVDYDAVTRELKLTGYLPGGKPFSETVLRFVYSEDLLIQQVQSEVVAFVRDWVAQLRPATIDDVSTRQELFERLRHLANAMDTVKVVEAA